METAAIAARLSKSGEQGRPNKTRRAPNPPRYSFPSKSSTRTRKTFAK